jgi:hypothetical protein
VLRTRLFRGQGLNEPLSPLTKPRKVPFTVRVYRDHIYLQRILSHFKVWTLVFLLSNAQSATLMPNDIDIRALNFSNQLGHPAAAPQ